MEKVNVNARSSGVRQPSRTITVWDLPTRVFHWTLATAFFAAWLTRGSAQQLDIHVFAGYTMLALIGFRVIWGLAGGTYARFSQFALRGQQLRDYAATLLSSRRQRYVGHNPFASVAIIALLTLSLALVLSGLFVLGGQKQHGPLAGWLSFEQGAYWGSIHEWIAIALLALVGLHVLGAIAESLLHRSNLIGTMIHGRRTVAGKVLSSARHGMTGAVLAVLLAGAGSATFWPWLTQDQTRPYQPFKGPALVQNLAWNEECGGCHLAYHPSLLPARSWRALLSDQASHFGEDLALDADVLASLGAYARANAAERHQTETAWQIERRIATDQVPQRISQTRYWKARHRSVADATWRAPQVKSKANCDACHSDANTGTFQPAAMKVPGATAERVRLALHRYAERLTPLSPAAAHNQEENKP